MLTVELEENVCDCEQKEGVEDDEDDDIFDTVVYATREDDGSIGFRGILYSEEGNRALSTEEVTEIRENLLT